MFLCVGLQLLVVLSVPFQGVHLLSCGRHNKPRVHWILNATVTRGRIIFLTRSPFGLGKTKKRYSVEYHMLKVDFYSSAK